MIYSARPKSRSDSDKSSDLRQGSLPIQEPIRLNSGSSFEETDRPLAELDRTELDRAGFDQDGDGVDQFDLVLATQIISRIESRLPGRIRHLAVYTTENAVMLRGECSTFYTKQVAQHAAMGVLEYEQLINNIDVRTAK